MSWEENLILRTLAVREMTTSVPKKDAKALAGTPLPAKKTLGERVRAAYVRAGYNRSEMARLLDRSLPTIKSWELAGTGDPEGVQDIKQSDLRAIADLCGVTVEWLATGRMESRVVPDHEPNEPPYWTWREFLREEGDRLSDDERRELAQHRRREGIPSVAYYKAQLGLLRAGFTMAERELGQAEDDAAASELHTVGGTVVDRKAEIAKRRKKG